MNYAPDSLMQRRNFRALPRWTLIMTTLVSVIVSLVSFRYFVPSIPMPINIAENGFRNPWLLIHVASAASALILGPAQFFPSLRARLPKLHRWSGRIYVVACTVGGISGFFLALGSSAGILSTLGFGLLALAWLATTVIGWQRAVEGFFENHHEWMIRSFALTLAAVTLRIYLPISALIPIPEEHSYRVISFLCWVPNLAFGEWYIRWRSNRKPEFF